MLWLARLGPALEPATQGRPCRPVEEGLSATHPCGGARTGCCHQMSGGGEGFPLQTGHSSILRQVHCDGVGTQVGLFLFAVWLWQAGSGEWKKGPAAQEACLEGDWRIQNVRCLIHSKGNSLHPLTPSSQSNEILLCSPGNYV